MPQSDKQLLERYRQGDHAAFNELFDRLEIILISYIWAKTGNHELAKDTCQEVFIKLATKPPILLFGRSLKPWLFKVANNLLADYWRQKTVPVDDSGKVPEFAVPADFINTLDVTERDKSLWKIILALPDQYRKVIILRFFSGCNHRQIANALAIPLGTALWRVKKALSLIREKLKAMEKELGR